MSTDEFRPLSELSQDEIAEEFGWDNPAFDDDGRELEDVTKREPEVKRHRGFPKGQKRPERAKDHVRMDVKLATDCYEHLQFLVANGNADSLTAALEMCVRGDRAAQRLPAKV